MNALRLNTRSAIDKHLKNPFYAAIPVEGEFRSQFIWRGVHYKAKHVPIFSVEEWAALQASFGRRASYRRLKHDGLFAQGPLTLRCADPECGCKITYAPKEKPSGIVYHYYRCGDGRRVHVGRKERQLNIREEDILSQLGGAVDAIALTEEIAHAITEGLNETHRQVRAAKADAVKMYRAQLAALDEKENRIVDMFANGNIEPDVFRRQQVRVREDRADLFNKLQDAESKADDAYLVTAQRVLELAKEARTLWNMRSPEERRDFLSKLLCNPVLDGRTVRYDLQKPFAILARMNADGDWRPQGEPQGDTHGGVLGIFAVSFAVELVA